MKKANTALITGASGGIGMELARVHARKGGNLILVARSRDKLQKLQQELQLQYKVEVQVIVADLSEAGAAADIFQQTTAMGLEVDTLINNAGFGGHGYFHQRELQAHQSMIQVNMTSLTNLCYLYLPAMIERNRGRILNVSSTASFMPGPFQAVYYASKSYVTSVSQAIAEEVAEHNVSVTALCPGAVDTGFVQAGDLSGLDNDLWKNARSALSVAEFGYKAMEQGKLVAVNEAGLSFVLNWIIPLLPRKLVLKMSRRLMEKS